MKKFFSVLIISILFLTGCKSNINSPTGAVEELFNKYQNLDSMVIADLDKVLNNDKAFNDIQREEYKNLMLNQYKTLSYKVVDEEVYDNEAEVDVEIEVLDYASSIRSVINENKDNNNNIDLIDLKIDKMKNTTYKTKYELTLYLTKIDNVWVVDELTDRDSLKIHGLYEG